MRRAAPTRHPQPTPRDSQDVARARRQPQQEVLLRLRDQPRLSYGRRVPQPLADVRSRPQHSRPVRPHPSHEGCQAAASTSHLPSSHAYYILSDPAHVLVHDTDRISRPDSFIFGT